MATTRMTVQGTADAETVWRRYSDPALWTSWAPHLTMVRTRATTISPGVTGVVTALWLIRARFRITQVNHPARTWEWEVTAGPLCLHLTHRVRALPEGGSTTDLSVTGPTLVVAAYRPVALFALGKLVSKE